MINAEEQFPQMLERCLRIVQSSFPLVGKKYTLQASNFRWDNVGNHVRDDIAAHKKAKLNDTSIMAKLRADLSLVDLAGKPVDALKNTVVLMVPHITARSSFIVGGKEVQTVNQLRLKPGLYTRTRADNNIETFVNTSAAGVYRVILDRETGELKFRIGTSSHFPMSAVLHCFGIGDGQMQQAWGPAIFHTTSDGVNNDAEAYRLYAKLRPMAPKPPSAEEAQKLVAEFLMSKPLDPITTKITTGHEFKFVGGDALLEACVRCIRLSKGETKPDDTESLAFKSIHSVEDFVPDRLNEAIRSIKYSLATKLDRTGKLAGTFHHGFFTRPVLGFFTQDEFARFPDQVNPVDMASTNFITTVMGEGGINSTHAVSNDVRSVHPSHIGVLDPIQTPEGQKIGVSGHLAIGAGKSGNSITLSLVNARTGKLERKTVQDIDFKVIAFPDQYDMTKSPPIAKAQKISGRQHAELREFAPAEVDYIIPSPTNVFSLASNAVPFLQTDEATRAGFVSRHIAQTVPLLDPDKPLVQASIGGVGFETKFGQASLPKSPAAGVITAVTPDKITIKDQKGTAHTVTLHNKFPLNGNTFYHDTPKVKVGDKVALGQILADNNFTKDGVLAIGKNLRIAYMPYKGMNFEDGLVISETCAKKMTSVHKYEERLDKNSDTKVGLQVFLAYYPDEATKITDRSKYDTAGIVKKGAIVVHGDLLVPAVRQQELHEDYDFARLHKALKSNWADVSLRWDHDQNGVVEDVVVANSFIKVIIHTEEQTQIGDKFSQRHGGKGIVTAIIPDNEMYRDSTNKPIDIIFNPAGIPGRRNPGQLYEAAAGKLALKTGKTYLTENFSPGSILDRVSKELTAAKMDPHGEESVTDPVTGRKYDRVLVGDTHFLKLKHLVAKKFSARGIGGQYSLQEQPTKQEGESAQRIGGLELFSLLAGDARHFINDAFSIKGNRNDEYWRALQNGLLLPKPKTPFVAEKFNAYMLASGVNMQAHGQEIKALPLTDAQIRAMSSGAIKDPTVITANNLKPEKDGLFDPAITGGIGGTNWAHIELAEPIVNPLMVKATAAVLGITEKDLASITSGASGLSGGKIVPNTKGLYQTGGAAVETMLKGVNIDAQLKNIVAQISTSKSAATVDKLNKQRRFLLGLKSIGMRPEQAYINRVIPVIPPKFRSISPMPDGSLNVSDANHGYREVLMVSNALRDMNKLGINAEHLNELRGDLQRSVSGLVGMTEPLTRSQHFKGFLQQVKGEENKRGFFQGKLMSRPQDLSGRSTVVVDHKLGLDQIGVPESMAMTLYQPFVVKRLVSLGNTAQKAKEMIEAKDDIALKALHIEVAERPVIMNRAPSLHKFNVLAFKPTLVQGQALRVNPLIVKGYNMDFDGDCLGKDTLLLVKMRPSETPSCSGADSDTVLALPHSIIPIESFPRTELTRNDDVQEYSVPTGTMILSVDPVTREFKECEVTRFSVHPNCEEWEVKTKRGRTLLASSDASLATIDLNTLGIVPTKPAESLHRLVPEIGRVAGGSTRYIPGPFGADIEVTESFAWLIGAHLGDGWTTAKDKIRRASVHLAYGKGGEAMTNPWIAGMRELGAEGMLDDRAMPHEFEGKQYTSHRLTLSSMPIAEWLHTLCGHKTNGKHLPVGFQFWPFEARTGLLAGLLDTDGSVVVAKSGKRICILTTVSSQLATDVLQLARSLGVGASKAERVGRKANRQNYWQVIFSGVGISALDGLNLRHPVKAAALATFKECVERGDINDRVPLPAEIRAALIEAVSKAGATRRNNRDKALNSRYNDLKRLTNAITRHRAQGYLTWLRGIGADMAQYEAWEALVMDTSVSWDEIVSVRATGNTVTMYDITVPETLTFCTADGLAVWDTAGIHVPISESARKEAFEKLLPSKNMFSPGDGRVMHMPEAESVLGLYMMTDAKGIPRKVASDTEALAQYHSKKCEINQAFQVGTKILTPGHVLINSVVPADCRIEGPLTKNALSTLVGIVAKKYPEKCPDVVNKLKDFGNHFVTELGFSVSLRDLSVDTKSRDKILADATANTKAMGFEAAHTGAVSKIKDLVHSDKDNRFVYMSSTSGAFGGKSGQVAHMLGGVVAVQDHMNRTIPVQIKKSFAEGMSLGEYWATMPGARKGMVDKGLSTGETGYLNKLLVNSSLDNVVSMVDCGTTDGVPMKLSDTDIIDRIVADGPLKGQLLTGERVREMRLKSQAALGSGTLLMRSPLRCHAQHGTCQKCFGLNESGQYYPIGYHLGVLAAQTVGEPSTQLALRAFHSAGALGSKSNAGFPRVEQLLHLPSTIKGKSILAMVSGVVSDVTRAPTGGWVVVINGMKHYVPEERGLAVAVGKKVAAGDQISKSGDMLPQDLLTATGDINLVRDRIIGELQDSFAMNKVNIKRRIFETILKPMTNRARVTDPGDGINHDVHINDVMSVNVIEGLNKKLKNKIQYESTLVGVMKAPHDSGDFIGRMQHDRLLDTMRAAPALGLTANFGPQGHPITQLALVGTTEIGIPSRARLAAKVK